MGKYSMVYSKHRFEFFSDGVMAIIMTIMVLEIPVPKPFSLEGFGDLLKSILIFFVSFFIVGGFLYKHHHLIDSVEKITPKMIWRNFVFLFLVALLPVFTKLILENDGNNMAIISYDAIFLLANISFIILAHEARKQIAPDELEKMKAARGTTAVGKLALVRFVISCALFLGMIVISILIPVFSIIMFIVFPVAFNLLNVFKEVTTRGEAAKAQSV
jgi:uncharacterized membrane protein